MRLLKFIAWAPWIVSHGVSDTLNSLLLKKMAIGISSVETRGYLMTIGFKDGSKLTAWDANKFCAWLCRGSITSATGKVYRWNDEMPTRRTMFKLKEALTEFFIGSM